MKWNKRGYSQSCPACPELNTIGMFGKVSHGGMSGVKSGSGWIL